MGKEQLKSYLGAFIVGGAVGMLGHIIFKLYFQFLVPAGVPPLYAIMLCIYTLAFLGGVFTYLGPYNKLADIGGMGAAVPMAGLAQGIAMVIYGARMEGAPNGKAVLIGLAGPARIFGCGFGLALILVLVKMFVLN